MTGRRGRLAVHIEEYPLLAAVGDAMKERIMADVTPEFIQLFAITRAYQRSCALTVAAELGIADLLAEKPLTAEELAAVTGSHAPTLYRLLRALSSIGVFLESDQRTFALTPMSEYLRKDHPLSLAPVSEMFGADYEWQAWGELAHSVRTGENAARHALGNDVWTYRQQHPEHGVIFDAAMRTMSRSTASLEIAAYDFGRHRVVADIAGGTGAMLAAVLAEHSGLTGILFDQAQVVAGAPAVLDSAGVADRVDIQSGSFFDRVPKGADAYILRRILHDWPDEDCVRILDRCHEAMDADARLLIIDAVIGPPNEDALAKFTDLMMLVSAGGRERTEQEWIALLTEGGFRLERAIPASANSHVLEAVPV